MKDKDWALVALLIFLLWKSYTPSASVTLGPPTMYQDPDTGEWLPVPQSDG